MIHVQIPMKKGEGKTSVKRSFTLVETLVAISIMMMVIVGPFDAIQNALIASYISRDQLIGNSLAQEAIEYVIGIRDGAYLYNRMNSPSTPLTFLAGIDSTTNSNLGNLNVDCIGHNCTVDPAASTPVAICSGACSPLYVNSSTNLYNQSGSGLQSHFTRSIRLCYMGNGGSCGSTPTTEAKLIVTVSWMTEGRPYSTILTEYLQSWL